MKKLSLLLGVLLLVAPASAQTPPPSGKPPQHQKKDKGRPDTPLEKVMDKMGKAFRKLRGEAKAGAFSDDAVGLVATMKEAATEAKKLEPLKTKDLPEDKRAEFVADFRGDLDKFAAKLDQLSAELKAGDTAAALKSVDQLAKTMKSDHEEFQPKGY